MKTKHSRLLVAASSAFLCIGSAHAADAVFSSAVIGAGDNDANVGLSSSKTYLNAVNTLGGALMINGVSFEASSGADPSGTGYTISGVPNTFPGGGQPNNVVGQLGSLVDGFVYGSALNTEVFTLSGLTAGQTYSLTYYNRSWDNPNPRTQNITTTSGATMTFNQDINAVGDLNLLRYTFTASGTTEAVNIAPVVSGTTFHIYGFSTEQTFNNTWTSGADWTTATWSGSVPNAAGTNADFTSQGSPTAINLNAAQTVGHVRFDGTNAWTLSGANTLTLQADVGAVSVLAATSGRHTISTAVTLNSDVLKTGSGTLVLSGALTDNGKNVTLGAGTLEIANASAQTMSGNISGGGSLAKSGAGTLTLSGPNTHTGGTTINTGTLALGSSGALGTSGTISMNGGTLEFSASNTTDYSSRLKIEDAKTATFDTNGQAVTFASALPVGSGSTGALTKTGAGTLTLTGSNTYTGATTVDAGTLKLQTGGTPLLTDNFTATGNPNTADLNYNLANRQTGTAATQSWTGSGNSQVGNATNVQQPSGTNGDYLLLAFGGGAKLGGLNLSTSNVAGPVKINFDMFKGAIAGSGTADSWTSFTLTGDGDGWPVAGSGEFGFLYRNNTGIQVFNNGTDIQSFSSTTGGDSFAFYLADSAGTGSAFAGNGTRVIVMQGSNLLGSYALNTGMGTSQIAFGSDGSGGNGLIGGVDNLGVNNFQTNVLDPSTAVSLTTSGATLELDGVLQTVASLSGVSGSAVKLGPLSQLTVNGSTNTSFDGVISGTLGGLTKSGNGTLTLDGSNTYTGATTVTAGTLKVTGSIATSDVTVNGGILASGSTGTIGKNVTVNYVSALAAGGVGVVGTASVANDLTFNSGSYFQWDINANKDGDGAGIDDGTAGTDFDNVNVTGAINVDNAAKFMVVFGNGVDMANAFWNTPYITQTWNMATIFGQSISGAFSPTVQTSADVSSFGSFTIDGTTLTWTAVPELSNVLIGGLLGAGLLRRRRRN